MKKNPIKFILSIIIIYWIILVPFSHVKPIDIIFSVICFKSDLNMLLILNFNLEEIVILNL